MHYKYRKNSHYLFDRSFHSQSTMFLAMLDSLNIKNIVDIRRFPSSLKFPQFNQENLKTALELAQIQYFHMIDLGGRRKATKDSKNTSCLSESFRGYADYMETTVFENAIEKLEKIALKQAEVYMCSEPVLWRCHRFIVSDYLKAKSWTVLHIMSIGEVQKHNYTALARVVDGHVFYFDKED